MEHYQKQLAVQNLIDNSHTFLKINVIYSKIVKSIFIYSFNKQDKPVYTVLKECGNYDKDITNINKITKTNVGKSMFLP